MHSSNGQAVIRVERSGTAAGSAADGGILPEIGGLPVVNCSQPAPWSTPPKKTYKQVKTIICFFLVKPFFLSFFYTDFVSIFWKIANAALRVLQRHVTIPVLIIAHSL